MKKLIIAGTSSGVGKTTITIGLMRALKNKNLNVAPFKVGADYIDTTYHKLASGNISTNLDEFMLSQNTIKRIFMKETKNSDIAIIEGVMGLFDGYQDNSNYCSTASMAKILNAPIILIIDAGKIASSIAAVVKGFMEFDKNLEIKGIILNNVSTESHYNILKNSIRKIIDIKILGKIPKFIDIFLSSRHLGLKLANEDMENENKISKIADIIEKNIDLSEIIEISKSKILNYTDETIDKKYNVSLAVAVDKAFNFYYKHSIEEFEKKGVKIIEFDTFVDNKLPKCDGVYIGGGYPELYADELSKNTSLMKDIKQKSENGMPIYAECGGLMYLGKHIVVNDKIYNMAGIFNGVSKMTKSLQKFGYCIAKSNYDTPITKKGEILKGHEFHHSIFESSENPIFDMEKELYDKSIKKWSGGYLYKNTLASYLHIHFSSNLKIVDNFCENMEKYKNKK